MQNQLIDVNGLWPLGAKMGVQHHASMWTNVVLLSIIPLGTYFRELLVIYPKYMEHNFLSRKQVKSTIFPNGGRFVSALMC